MGQVEKIARIFVAARQLGRAYAEAHPNAIENGVLPGARVDMLIAASQAAAGENLQAEQASAKRGREAFLEGFEDGALQVWKGQAGMPEPKSSEAGDIEIASVQYFGRWRVQVYRLARTAQDQENTLTGIKADNWQEMEGEAQALMLAAFGTIETHKGLYCPPELAAKARWQAWETKNTEAREGLSYGMV